MLLTFVLFCWECGRHTWVESGAVEKETEHCRWRILERVNQTDVEDEKGVENGRICSLSERVGGGEKQVRKRANF